jgi:hypothetical protein
MKISHPRFLIIGNQENVKLEFPGCLTKKTDSVQSGAYANPNIMSETVFSFPTVSFESIWGNCVLLFWRLLTCFVHMNYTLFQDTSIQGETPLSWPLWFRAADPGDISLYMSIYYEIEDISSVIRYRTLRLHYNVQVSITCTESESFWASLVLFPLFILLFFNYVVI